MFKFHRKALTGLGFTAAAIAASGVLAAPAQAATAGQAKVVGWTVVQFNALMGKTNSVTITRSGRTVTIDDKVAIKPGKGCKRVKGDKTKVKCTTKKATKRIDAALGDKNDWLNNKSGVIVVVSAGAGNDKIIGGPKADTLIGEAGKDVLVGAAGDDVLVGGTGNDSLNGDAGEDVLDGQGGADFLKGGPALDMVFYGDRTKPVTVDLDGAKGDDGERGEKDTVAADVEAIFGGKKVDKLTGNAQKNFVFGGPGNDIIRGGAADDILFGDAGNDNIGGQAGDDQLFGDSGATSATARDYLDGGANTPAKGDLCEAGPSSRTVNCEFVGGAALGAASAAGAMRTRVETGQRGVLATSPLK